MTDKKSKEIDMFVQSVLEKSNYVGVSVAVVKGNEIVYAKGFGVTSLETHEPLQSYHNFHVASVSKTFVATAVMQLVEQGKIKLDDPLDFCQY
jgi:CubicO group peptidase (beta-lactamase class C family)